ncbi:DEAD/DEAH box helicase [Piscinibacter sp. HJYY11]|uniref:DEAD/DEAH box helicase n=1 Tax=Piscinibacter sp. HJYY11 TaxID=2801333 RepID=UPI00191EE1BB|nr:DEAD/DEAH box helicase [Piscinibacter sp. HJYY11]MBL0728745.1 DEAD/DEAH box helicase [Piscinibacter sp. HJYY11]
MSSSGHAPASTAHRERRFRPRLTLQTLNRGHGLLGLAPSGSFGPRGPEVTVARITWLYRHHDGREVELPAPTSVLNSRGPAVMRIDGDDGRPWSLTRERAAEADALDAVWAAGLHPLPEDALQWRSSSVPRPPGPLWTLVREDQFGEFWAERVPEWQAAGWSVVVLPGFAHETLQVQAWKLIVEPATGELLGRELAGPLGTKNAEIAALRQPWREGSWMLSLGVEIAGETWDLVPLLADLLKRDSRWLSIAHIVGIDDRATVRLHAPGGRRIDAPAAPVKAIVRAMVDLLTDPARQHGPLPLGRWDAHRLELLRSALHDTQARRAGPHGQWQLQGEAGLRLLADRLRLAGTPPPVAAPRGLQLRLRPYQLAGLDWLQYLREHQLGGILADDMGLGKTAQALAHLLVEKEAGRLDRPALVVLPTSLLFNWRAEAQRMAPGLRLLVLQGPDRAKQFARIAEHDVVLTTYPLLWRDVDALVMHPFHIVILDEAQAVKNATSRSAGALRRLQTRHRLCLTGTPLENNLGELWAQFDFLMPGFLGDSRSFARQWRKPIEENGETVRAERLAQRVRPFILRRRKQDVATELPPLTEVIERVQLQGRQRELYESVRVASDEIVRRMLTRRGFEGAQITILDALLKLRQVCCDPRLLKGHKTPRHMERAKLDWLHDQLPALVAEGRRVLVFSQFTQLLSLIELELEGLQLPWLALTGRTPVARRGEVVQRFQSGDTPILLVSLKAGGQGLNLTAADTVIHMDPWWNPAVEAQATARAHRIGQAQPVFVYKLIAEGSIEERMLALQDRKRTLADGILGHDEEATQKFSEQDLAELLAPLL